MTREEYNTLKKLTPDTLKEIRSAIYEYNCRYPYCELCALSIDNICVYGAMNRDKELDKV